MDKLAIRHTRSQAPKGRSNPAQAEGNVGVAAATVRPQGRAPPDPAIEDAYPFLNSSPEGAGLTFNLHRHAPNRCQVLGTKCQVRARGGDSRAHGCVISPRSPSLIGILAIWLPLSYALFTDFLSMESKVRHRGQYVREPVCAAPSGDAPPWPCPCRTSRPGRIPLSEEGNVLINSPPSLLGRGCPRDEGG